jgi:hypothetical protein
MIVLILVAGFVSALIQLPMAFYRGILVPILRGTQCPTCGECGMARVAAISFSYRFYRCDFCGQRCKRLDYQSPWFDASGPDDDDMYKPIPVYGPARHAEAFAFGLKSIALFACFIGTGVLMTLIGKFWGIVAGLTFFLVAQLATLGLNKPKILSVHPPLWDGQIDAGESSEEP